MRCKRPTPKEPLRIGTRGSPLALAQAREVQARLAAWHQVPLEAFEIVVIKVSGDQLIDRPLREFGGKGLFTREIEEALCAGTIDLAVHSAKDMPTALPAGLVVDVFLPREDVRDAFVAAERTPAMRLVDLAPGAVVGTSSLRRRAQVLAKRPDLRVVDFRGNVQTRLRKLAEGIAEATFLAMAGLKRLGLTELACAPVEPEEMLPAVGQGAIGVERRADDNERAAFLEPIACAKTALELACERAFLHALDGSCRTPIAGLARVEGSALWMRGEVLSPDGRRVIRAEARGDKEDAVALGRAVAGEILAELPPDFFARSPV